MCVSEIKVMWNGTPPHLEHMYGLLLDRENSQDVPVEVEALVVGQDDLVTLEGPGVTQSACVKVNNVERVVFQRRSGVGSHRFVVPVHLGGVGRKP